MTKVRIGRRSMPLPGSRWARVALGGALVVGGCVGFLPILGFWMVPLGLLILSVDLPAVRRRRRRFALWWHRRRRAETAARRAQARAERDVHAHEDRAGGAAPTRDGRRIARSPLPGATDAPARFRNAGGRP